MDFLKYANENQINVIPKENFSKLTEETFKVISSNLAKSLGPLGSSTTIFDGTNTSATKDGYSILKSMKFKNVYKSMLYNLIKTPCTKLNNLVGDGTTSVVVLTSLLFEKYQERNNSISSLYRLPRQFIHEWDDVIKSLIEKITSYAIPVNSSDYERIYNLSYVASNGNHEISDNIAKAYSETEAPNIKLKSSPTNKSYISPVIGFEFPANLIDQIYAKNEDLSSELKDIYTITLDYKVESDFCNTVLFPLDEIFRNKGKKLLVIAPSYDALLANTTLQRYVEFQYQRHHDINLILTQYAQGKLDENQLLDLCVILRSKLVTQEIGNSLKEHISTLSDGEKYDFFDNTDDTDHPFHGIIGRCDNVVSSCTNGSIFRPINIFSDERYQETLRVAENALAEAKSTTDYEKQNYAFKVSKAKARINQLQMKNYVYYIGADSSLQANIIHDAVEDVVKAVSSAVKSGIVPGCQLSIIKATKELLDELSEDNTDSSLLRKAILEIILHALYTLYNLILIGPDRLGILKTIPRWQYTTPEGMDELRKEEENKRWEIIETSVKDNRVFDLETLSYSDSIITSAETDTAILLAASELIKLLISGNQCVYLDASIDNTTDTTVDAFV